MMPGLRELPGGEPLTRTLSLWMQAARAGLWELGWAQCLFLGAGSAQGIRRWCFGGEQVPSVLQSWGWGLSSQGSKEMMGDER